MKIVGFLAATTQINSRGHFDLSELFDPLLLHPGLFFGHQCTRLRPCGRKRDIDSHFHYREDALPSCPWKCLQTLSLDDPYRTEMVLRRSKTAAKCSVFDNNSRIRSLSPFLKTNSKSTQNLAPLKNVFITFRHCFAASEPFKNHTFASLFDIRDNLDFRSWKLRKYSRYIWARSSKTPKFSADFEFNIKNKLSHRIFCVFWKIAFVDYIDASSVISRSKTRWWLCNLFMHRYTSPKLLPQRLCHTPPSIRCGLRFRAKRFVAGITIKTLSRLRGISVNHFESSFGFVGGEVPHADQVV